MKESLESIRHARSKKDFPYLSLEEGEYVELAITRSKASLFAIWFFAITALLILTLVILSIPSDFLSSSLIPLPQQTLDFFSLALFILYALILIIAAIGTKIHFGNKLFITNKRAIQRTVSGLFGESVNIVELSRIEDVIFKQANFIQKLFNYGTIRMSTVGDETTYTFHFVSTPTDEVQSISHLVHMVREKKNKEN